MKTKQIETINLRGHHVDLLKFELQYGSLLGKGLATMVEILGYGPKYTYKLKKIIHEQLTPESKINIVEGSDDICKICPHNINCSNGDHDKTLKKIKRRIIPLRLFLSFPSNVNFEKYDGKYLNKYNLKIGGSYTLDEILKR